MRKWLLINNDRVIARVIAPNEPGESSGHDVSGLDIFEVSEFKNEQYNFDPTTKSWVPNLVMMREKGVTEVNRNREHFQKQYLTPGEGKQQAYQGKELEVLRWKNGELRNFPYAEAQAALTAETVNEVLTSFDLGIQRAHEACASIEAICMKALKEISEATTPEQIELASKPHWLG